MSQPRPLRIAILGGGLAGATLIHALIDKPNLDVHIFESAPVFKEEGAAIGLTQNARRALKLVGQSALQCLSNAGAVPVLGYRWMMARGPDAGKEIDRNDATDQPITNIVHRADFLRELLDKIPVERMHASKKLKEIEQAGEDTSAPLELHFDDGTVHECDVLVGADGIHSRVRKYVVGENNPAATPVSAGWWCVQALKPYEQGVAALGKEYLSLDYPTEFAYLGDGAWWMHNCLSEGNLVQIVIAIKCDPDEAKGDWKRMFNTEEILKVSGSFPSPVNKAIEELICDKPETMGFYLWEHLHASTYCRGNVCMIGDAAHSTTPWQSSGVGMAVEDVLVLSSLLCQARNPQEAQVALQVFDQIRRPRTQRVVDSSHGTGLIATGTKADFDLFDLKQMKQNLSQRWDFIRYLDLSEHRDQALELMRKQLARA